MARLHMLDCAALLKFCDFQGKTLIDVGTGAQGHRPQADKPGEGQQGPQIAQAFGGEKEVGGQGQEDQGVSQPHPGQGPLDGGGGGVAGAPAVLRRPFVLRHLSFKGAAARLLGALDRASYLIYLYHCLAITLFDAAASRLGVARAP